MKMFPAGTLPLNSKRGTPVRLLNRGRPAAKVQHFSAPLKGLSRYAELTDTDPMKASILTNWVVEDDRITVRPGYKKLGQIPPTNVPIETLIPFYGDNPKIAAAAGPTIYDTAGVALRTGFTGASWAWASFSNLSSVDFTIMVNGHDGVFSWDGATFVNEAVTIVPGETWIDVTKLDKVLVHMNRLWFADSQNLAVYYLPLQLKTGPLEGMLPLNAIFKRGGNIRGIYTWTIDGGLGLDDALVIFSSNGEVAVYSGTDPGMAGDFKLVGIFRFDAPMSRDSIINFGGDLYAMISTGLVPMTTLIKAETEELGKSDINVMKDFEEVARSTRDRPGWQVILNQHTNHAICNMPTTDGKYQQMVRKMPGQVWAKWQDVPARCWGWLNSHTYFGSDTGGIYIGGPDYLTDDGAAINADVRFAWSSFKSVQKKEFKLARLYIISDGQPRPFVDLEVDYNNVAPTNQPELTFGPSGSSDWSITGLEPGAAMWDTADWFLNTQPRQNWQGITGLGRVGAARVRVSVTGATFSLSGIDILYELGGLM